MNSNLLLLFISKMSRKGKEIFFPSSYVKLMLGSIWLSFCMIEVILCSFVDALDIIRKDVFEKLGFQIYIYIKLGDLMVKSF